MKHYLLQKCSFFLIKLAVFQASGAACMRLRLAGTVNRLNPPQEGPILMTLRFIDFKTSKPRNFEG
jgi:hypothetical protein